ncbi:hypothetical protein CRG98_048568, partial [Punica granatum]
MSLSLILPFSLFLLLLLLLLSAAPPSSAQSQNFSSLTASNSPWLPTQDRLLLSLNS